MAKDKAHEIELSAADLAAVRGHGTAQAGPARIWFEDADIVRAEFADTPMTLQDFIYLHRLFEERLHLGERIYFLAILPNGGGHLLPPEARRWVADWNRRHQAHCLAIVCNVSWLNAAMTQLLMRAIGLLRDRPLPFAYFKTESEARRWIDTLRATP